jgi:hypothetical protein
MDIGPRSVPFRTSIGSTTGDPGRSHISKGEKRFLENQYYLHAAYRIADKLSENDMYFLKTKKVKGKILEISRRFVAITTPPADPAGVVISRCWPTQKTPPRWQR